MAAAAVNENERPSFWSEIGFWRGALLIVGHQYCSTQILKGHFFKDDDVDASPSFIPEPIRNPSDPILSWFVWLVISTWSWASTVAIVASIGFVYFIGSTQTWAWLIFSMTLFSMSAMAFVLFLNSKY